VLYAETTPGDDNVNHSTIPRHPEIKREFEPLFLRDGRLVLNSIYGRQILINKPPALARELFAACSDGRTLSDVRERIESLGDEWTAYEKLLEALVAQGVVANSLAVRRPEDVSPDLFARFETEIAHLQRYETPSASAFDFFRRLRQARVTVIGVGGNGSIVAMMLAAAGVGHLHLVDGDIVEESNLVRQIFYTEADALTKRSKVEALAERVSSISRFTSVTTELRYIEGPVDVENAAGGRSCVVLCADAPRFVINRWVNDACWKLGVPHINAFAGMVGPFTVPGESPCFGCLENKFRQKLGPLHDQIVEALQEERTRRYPSFVLGPIAVGDLQVREVIGFLTGAWQPRSFNGVIRLSAGGTTVEPFERELRCAACLDALLRKGIG
jgi:molybdopterin/thiamine biosynthesis adenylyltransferase